jgi:hypothetical protein
VSGGEVQAVWRIAWTVAVQAVDGGVARNASGHAAARRLARRARPRHGGTKEEGAEVGLLVVVLFVVIVGCRIGRRAAGAEAGMVCRMRGGGDPIGLACAQLDDTKRMVEEDVEEAAAIVGAACEEELYGQICRKTVHIDFPR